jgi:hypothetical protein
MIIKNSLSNNIENSSMERLVINKEQKANNKI